MTCSNLGEAPGPELGWGGVACSVSPGADPDLYFPSGETCQLLLRRALFLTT